MAEPTPVSFEQDPDEEEFGYGYFTRPDGSKFYSSDPALAKELDRGGNATFADRTEENTAPAQSGPVDYDTSTYDTRLNPDEESRYAAWKEMYAPQDSGDDYDLRGAFRAGIEPDPENGHWPDTFKKPNHPTFSNESRYAKDHPERAGSWNGEAYVPPAVAMPASPVTPPAKPMPLAGTSAARSQTGSQQQSNNVQRSRSAMPEQVMMAAQQGTSDAYDSAVQTSEDNRFAEAAQHAQHAQQVEQRGRDQERAASAAIAQNTARKTQTLTKIAEVSGRKTDNQKIWKDAGVMGTIGGLLGVFLGSLSSGILGTENTALKAVMDAKKQNIDSQLADRDSELRGLERELGSIEAALPVFEARMNEALKQQTEALLIDEKSAAALRGGRDYIAKLEIEKQAQLKKGAEAYYGTLATQEQSATSSGFTDETGETRKPATGGMGGLDLMKKAFEIDKIAEERGWDESQRAALYKKFGVPMGTGETGQGFDRRTAEQKAQEAKAKSDDHEKKALATEQAVTSFYKKAGLKQVDGKWMVDEAQGSVPPGFVESINPFDDDDISANGEAAAEAFGRLQSDGVISPSELPRFRTQLGLDTGNRKQLAARANALMPLIRERRPESRRGSEKVPGDWK